MTSFLTTLPVWMIYTLFAGMIGSMIFAGIWFFILRNRNKFIVHIQRNGETIKTLKLKRDLKVFSWKKKTYKVNFEGSTKDKKHRPVLYYDIDNIDPIVFEGLTTKRNPEDLQAFMKSEALQKLLSRDAAKKLFTLMIVAIIAVGAVAFGAFYFINSSNSNLAHLFQQYMNITNGGKLK
jgi:hypothetical protein